MSDQQAENAICEAISDLVAKNSPRNSATVPQAALERILGNGASRDDAQERISKALRDMEERGELIAPNEPWKDWQLAKNP